MFKKLPGLTKIILLAISYWLAQHSFSDVGLLANTPVFASDRPSFIKVKDLEVGDAVFQLEQTTPLRQDFEGQVVNKQQSTSFLKSDKIIEKKWVDEPTEVYNLTVDGEETFFANDLAVHNKGTWHNAYFFLDSNGNGYHDSGEAISGPNTAYTSFYSPCKEEDGPWRSETIAYKINAYNVPHKYPPPSKVYGSDDARMGLTGASQYGCGPSAYALPQTTRTSPYYVGGVKFKDYDGTPRPAYRYSYYEGVGDVDNMRYQNRVYSWDWKGEKDYTEGNRGFILHDDLLQVAEFNVDYTGKYYIHPLGTDHEKGNLMVAPKMRNANMPVKDINLSRVGWNSFQADGSYGDYTSRIRQINSYCVLGCREGGSQNCCSSSNCGEGIILDDNTSRYRNKSGGPTAEMATVGWSDFTDNTGDANSAFAPLGGINNVKVITVWSQPFRLGGCGCDDDSGNPHSYSYQWVIDKNNATWLRSKKQDQNWTTFSIVDSSGFNFLGGVANVKSRDVACANWQCHDRIFTNNNQAWERVFSAGVTSVLGCGWGEAQHYYYRINWSLGAWTNVTATYESLLRPVLGDNPLAKVEDAEKMCVEHTNYGWAWYLDYCRDTIITTDGRAFSKEFKRLPAWHDVGAGDAICWAGDGQPGACWLDKNQTYLMIFLGRYDDKVGYSGVPFIWWAGGQESDGGWYESNKTSTIPIASFRPTISGRVFVDANLNCADNTESGVAGATVYLDSWGSNPRTTLGDGSFIFENVTAGNHNVFIQPPSGYQVRDGCGYLQSGDRYYQVINAPAGGTGVANFALVRTGSIFGHVYEYSTSATCASLETTNPVGGITVRSTNGSLSNTTNSEGYFNLGTQIPVGTYVLEVDPNTLEGYSIDDILYCPAPPGRSLTISAGTGGDYEVNIGLLRSVPWFQVEDGDAHAQGVISSSISETATEGYFDLDGEGGTPGVVSYRGLSASFGEGEVSSQGWLAQTAQERKLYSYFYRLLDSPTEENFNGTLPSNNGVYYAASGQTLSGNWTLPADRKIVVLVDGDLEVGVNIDVPVGSSLVIVVSGGINFTGAVARAEGIFLANGTINTGSASGAFVGEGSFVAGGFSLNRDFRDGRNNTSPVEQFIFRPDILLNSLSDIWPSEHIWEEIAPSD